MSVTLSTDTKEYLRCQPDNLHSIDMIAKVTELLNGVYTHVNLYSIDLCTQLFDTLHEMCEVSETQPICQCISHNRFLII